MMRILEMVAVFSKKNFHSLLFGRGRNQKSRLTFGVRLDWRLVKPL